MKPRTRITFGTLLYSLVVLGGAAISTGLYVEEGLLTSLISAGTFCLVIAAVGAVHLSHS